MIQPPTDNLYKFMAISGMLLACFFLIFPLMQLRELRQKQIQLLGESEVLSVEIKSLHEDIESLGRNSQSLTDVMSDKEHQKKFWRMGKQYVDFMVGEFKYGRDKLEQTHEKGRLIEVKDAEIKTKNKLIELVDYDIRFIRWVGYVGNLGATFLAVYGFMLWYKKVQRPLDLITARDALEAGKPKTKEASA